MDEKTTFFHHQKQLLFSAIKTVWERQQQTLIGLLHARNDRIVLGGDSRADSAGHSAKYGTYTSIELMLNCILDVKIIARSELEVVMTWSWKG